MHLSEKDKRLWVASEANTIGRGGSTIVQQATGILRVTISGGQKAVSADADVSIGRV